MPCLIASVAKNLDGVLLFFDVVYSSFKFLLYVCLFGPSYEGPVSSFKCLLVCQKHANKS